MKVGRCEWCGGIVHDMTDRRVLGTDVWHERCAADLVADLEAADRVKGNAL